MTHQEFLFKVLDILDSNNIEYCFFAGTLLGAFRDQSFLPCDHKDTDIAIDDKYYWQIRNIFNQFVLKNEMKWNGIWRKELSIASIDNKFKVDIFCMEKIKDKYWVYSYKPNDKNGKWNHEWAMTFTASSFFPTEKLLFLGREVKIPNESFRILTEQYGTWQIPDKNFISKDTTCYNVPKNYKGFYPAGMDYADVQQYTPDNKTYDIACIFTTIERNESIKNCIESIRTYRSDMKIYVADQNPPSAEMIKFYEDHYVEYYFTPSNSGLSFNRNFLVSKVQEPYIFVGDDDFVFTEDTKIEIFKEILIENPTVGIVGGNLSNTVPYNKRLLYDSKKKKIYKIQTNEPLLNTKNNYKYNYTDMVLNFFLAKKELFNDITWDNELYLVEHLDFFLRLKNTKWKVAFTPEVTAIHASVRPSRYKSFRRQWTIYYPVFLKKYGLKKLEDIVDLTDKYWKEPRHRNEK